MSDAAVGGRARRPPVGVWIEAAVPDGPLVAFTYVDPEAGLTAQGTLAGGRHGGERRVVRLPLPDGARWRAIPPDEAAARQLDTPPDWVAKFYGPQPPPGADWGGWQDHPRLTGRFHPAFPDDVPVLVHDGGPTFTAARPELVWVRVRGQAGSAFTGTVLNQPHKLARVHLGDVIRFVAPDGGEYPLQVSDRYLHERPRWVVHPCPRCGLTELFDAPSDLIRRMHPDRRPGDAGVTRFTTPCGVCGSGVEAEAVA